MASSHSNSVAQASPPEYKVVAAKVYDPKQPSIFGKGKKSERATYSEILCACDSCPLLAKKQCVQVAILGCRCPHGDYKTETGPTQRAGSYWEWVSDHNKKAKEVGGWLKFPAKKLAFIGDYVYLPYAHADNCKAVPFLSHSAFILSGRPFIKREDWTVENVIRLLEFRPRGLMTYDEITSYQKEEVPLFISHIREVDPAMWADLIEKRPEYDTAPNYIGRKALLATLTHPITIPPKDNRYPVAWVWDGTYLTTTDKDCYGNTWGGIPAESLELKLRPTSDAAVVVSDSAWVIPSTVFVD